MQHVIAYEPPETDSMGSEGKKSVRADRKYVVGENMQDHTLLAGDSFHQSNLDSDSSETTIMEIASMTTTSCFSCEISQNETGTIFYTKFLAPAGVQTCQISGHLFLA